MSKSKTKKLVGKSLRKKRATSDVVRDTIRDSKRLHGSGGASGERNWNEIIQDLQRRSEVD